MKLKPLRVRRQKTNCKWRFSAVVTRLEGDEMYTFLERFLNEIMPSWEDFGGLDKEHVQPAGSGFQFQIRIPSFEGCEEVYKGNIQHETL